MGKYSNIYRSDIVDKVKEGKTVYCLDRKLAEVIVINSLEVSEYAKLMHEYDEDSYRFEFWLINDEEGVLLGA